MAAFNKSAKPPGVPSGSRRSNSAWTGDSSHLTTPQIQNNNNNNPQINFMHKKLNFLFGKAVGSKIVATVASGARYTGILSAVNTETEIGIVLKQSVLQTPAPGDFDPRFPNNSNSNQIPQSELVIPPKELVAIEFLSVNLNPDPKPRSGFKTDADISAGTAGTAGTSAPARQRPLQPWKPETGESGFLGMALEEETGGSGSGSGSWDQFAVNEAKFGIRSEFREELYTTKLATDTPGFAERARKAEQLAREITAQDTGGNAHLAEERGIVVDDSGVDEEDKYSGVTREFVAVGSGSGSGSTNRNTGIVGTPSGAKKGQEILQAIKSKVSVVPTTGGNGSGKGKYVPPAFRNGTEGIDTDPAIVSATAGTWIGVGTEENVKPKDLTDLEGSEEPKERKEPKVPQKASDSATLDARNDTKPSDHWDSRTEINSLKEFSANFKIPASMKPKPDAGKAGQPSGATSGATSGAEAASLPIPTGKETPGGPKVVTNQAISATSATSATQPQSATSPRKQPLKFNPAAASFVPSFAKNSRSPGKQTAPQFSPQKRTTQPHKQQRGTPTNSAPQPPAFFTQGKPKSRARPGIRTAFNPFLYAKATAPPGTAPHVDPAFTVAPAWDSTVEQSYRSVFAVPEAMGSPFMVKTPYYSPNSGVTMMAPMPMAGQMAGQMAAPIMPMPMLGQPVVAGQMPYVGAYQPVMPAPAGYTYPAGYGRPVYGAGMQPYVAGGPAYGAPSPRGAGGPGGPGGPGGAPSGPGRRHY